MITIFLIASISGHTFTFKKTEVKDSGIYNKVKKECIREIEKKHKPIDHWLVIPQLVKIDMYNDTITSRCVYEYKGKNEWKEIHKKVD